MRPAGMACGAGRRHAWEESRWSGRGGWKTQSGGVLEPSQTRQAAGAAEHPLTKVGLLSIGGGVL